MSDCGPELSPWSRRQASTNSPESPRPKGGRLPGPALPVAERVLEQAAQLVPADGTGRIVEQAALGDIDVYKVSHHGSRFSSNDTWLEETAPEAAIISVGGNSFGHPTADALSRLHEHGVQTYWTNSGSGVNADPMWDRVGGTIVIEALPGSFTVSGTGFADTYQNE